MKKTKVMAIALALGLCIMGFAGCGTSGTAVTTDINAMDTTMTLTAFGENANDGIDAAIAEIEKLDATLSTGNPDSEIAQLNAKGSATLGEDASYLVQRALDLNESTDGAFDITVYPLMVEWGFTNKEYKVPDKAVLDDLLSRVDSSKIKFDASTGDISLPEGVAIDLGGIAKGYTSSRVMEIFAENGIESAMISLGGNVQLMGPKPDGSNWRIGIEAPEDDASEMVGVVETTDCAVITSGGYERFFEEDGVRYHHILDPATGKPADSGLTSVTIVSRDGTLSDGLSTSLFIMGADKAIDYWHKHSREFDFVLVQEDGPVLVSNGISNIFTSEREYEVIE